MYRATPDEHVQLLLCRSTRSYTQQAACTSHAYSPCLYSESVEEEWLGLEIARADGKFYSKR